LSKPGTSATEILAAVSLGDERAVMDVLGGLTEKQRRAAADDIQAARRDLLFGRRREREDPTRAAYALAYAGVAAPRPLATTWFYVHDGDEVNLAEVLQGRGQRFIDTFARAVLEPRGGPAWRVLRVLVRRGFVARPDDAGYITGMVSMIGNRHGRQWWTPTSVYEALVADPELLDREVWEIFTTDCGAELTNARVYESSQPGMSKPTGENRWTIALVRLADEERLDRQRLLDESLGAQMRDFQPSMVTWYIQLHEALAPTYEERVTRAQSYLALLSSPTPTVVKGAIDALKVIEESIPAEELATAASGPLGHKQKNLAMEMLRLLDRAQRRDTTAAGPLLLAVADGLAHERSDVQARALEILERSPGLDPPVRARVLELVELSAPSLRERANALAGIADTEVSVDAAPEAPSLSALERWASMLDPTTRAWAGVDATLAAVADGRWPPPARIEMTPELLRLVGTRLEPVESFLELVQLTAALLEGQGSGDDPERFLDGLSRMGADRPPGFDRLVAALSKRAEKVAAADTDMWYGSIGARAIAELVRIWAAGKVIPPIREPWLPGGLSKFLNSRIEEVADTIAKLRSRGLMAFPSHEGGWIDPDVLAERKAHRNRFTRPHRSDADQAKARAFPAIGPIDPPTTVALRQVRFKMPNLESELGALSKAVSDIDDLPLGQVPRGTWNGSDLAGARWTQTIIPTLPEVPLGVALMNAVMAVDASGSLGRPAVALETLLDPDARVPRLGWLAIAVSLVSRSPDLQRTATDVTISTIDDGRFDPDELGASIAWMFNARTQIGAAGRLANPLSDVSRVSQLHAAQIVRVVTALAAALEKAPNGFNVPLEIAAEQAFATGLAISDPVQRAAIERHLNNVSRGSKLGRSITTLLSQTEDPGATTTLKLLAAEKSLRRAERYSGALLEVTPTRSSWRQKP
jgi:Family of unknown function (DUF6493)